MCLLLFVVIIVKYSMRGGLTNHACSHIITKMSKVRKIDIKNRTYYFFDDTVIVKNLDLDNIV